MIDFNKNKIWSIDTCHPSYQSKWSENNPSAGQCLVTALAVQDELGGQILSCKVGTYSHYINMINGVIYDYTKDQFKKEHIEYRNIKEKSRESLLKNKDTLQRYLLLKERIQIYEKIDV